MVKNKIKAILALSAMVVLIINSRQAIAGAHDGIKLCLYTVIPALFPYCVLSMIFQSSIFGEKINILKPIERLCKMPTGSGIILLLGLLGGYPTGAIYVSRAKMNKAETNRMTIFCNNAGPSFIFGVVSTIFPNIKILITIWLIQIISALITGVIINKKSNSSYSAVSMNNTKVFADAAHAMLNVCTTIILFRVLISCISPKISGVLPNEISSMIFGILELTNGIMNLENIKNVVYQFVICCGLLSFGGICVAIQTASISRNINIKQYLFGKIIHALISICLAMIVAFSGYIILLIPTTIIVILTIMRLKKKEVAFLN